MQPRSLFLPALREGVGRDAEVCENFGFCPSLPRGSFLLRGGSRGDAQCMGACRPAAEARGWMAREDVIGNNLCKYIHKYA